jgi:hypothetical protein
MDESDQLERLLSEAPDGELTPGERAEVRRALAADPAAEATARAYEHLNDLLAGWRALPDAFDWEEFARQAADHVSRAAAGQGSEASGRPEALEARPGIEAVDRLVDDWAVPVPEVDWDALKSRISAAVREEVARAEQERVGAPLRWRRAARWGARVGAPLAAAAAIAILVWWPRTELPIVPVGGDSAGPCVVVSLEMPESVGRISVTFEEGPAAVVEGSAPPAMGVAIAVSSPTAELQDTADEALFY